MNGRYIGIGLKKAISVNLYLQYKEGCHDRQTDSLDAPLLLP